MLNHAVKVNRPPIRCGATREWKRGVLGCALSVVVIVSVYLLVSPPSQIASFPKIQHDDYLVLGTRGGLCGG